MKFFMKMLTLRRYVIIAWTDDSGYSNFYSLQKITLRIQNMMQGLALQLLTAYCWPTPVVSAVSLKRAGLLVR